MRALLLPNAKVDGKTNILAGIYGSDGYVDKYVKEHYTVDKSLFDHHGSYFLASNKGEIVILGLDTDAVFYGITSLKHIFNQMDGTTIRNFEMRDYADVNIRGFIEGYYGLPWSNEDRMSLMRFGGDYKMRLISLLRKTMSITKENGVIYIRKKNWQRSRKW